MLIYTSEISPRLRYTFDFVLTEVLHLKYNITTNLDDFKHSSNPIKWTYGSYQEGFHHHSASSLLFENDIQYPHIERIEHEDIIALFPTNDSMSKYNFDIFASTFYLISRYEEYLPCVLDQHGRYAVHQSAAYTYGFLETTMVNRYILFFAHWLKSTFPSIDIQLDKPKAILTIDVDHPFYTQDVSLIKWMKRTLKSLGSSSEKDKYDTFDFIIDTMGDLTSIFFILCPKEPSDMDHFNHRDSCHFLDLIEYLKSKSKLGIHPSYYAEEKKLLKEEVQWLEDKHGRHLKSARFHYLRMQIERSFSELIAAGIQNDFSLGYGTQAGFRTSTSHPYYFFDLVNNRKTNLRIYTPCIMDSSFKYGDKSNFEEKSEQLILEVKTYGGLFIPIFHNDILSEETYQNWFKNCIQSIRKHLYS